jgi:two-component system LytT family response regulator
VREHVRDRAAGVLAQQLGELLADVTRAATTPLDRVAVRDRGRLVLLDPRDIEWVAADGDYLRINASARSYLVRETLTAMEARLPAARFVRIHRSSIVSVAHIAALEPLPNREFIVVLRDGTRLRSSRSYESRLRRALDALM